ncbi:MAG: TetR family transcriptional regulator [Pseudomonadota bacterium]
MNSPAAGKRRRAEAVDRERVLDAAATLFREQGFEKTTLKEIAEACGMLPGSLHYRYASKELLLVDMMRLAMTRVTQAAVEACAGIDDPLEQVRRTLLAHLHTAVAGSDTVYVLLFDWRSLGGQARDDVIDLRDRYEDQWMYMLKQLRNRGLVREDIDLHLLRLVGLGAINWVATWYRADGRYSLADIGNFIWQMISDAVLTPEARQNHQARYPQPRKPA